VYYAAQDIIEYLMASVGGGAQDSEHAALRAAAHSAYRDVINARDWHWHVSEATLADDPNPSLGSGDGVTSFTLPENVKNLDALITPQSSAVPTVYLTPTEWLRIEVKFPQVNAPVYWTALRDPAAPDRWLVKLAGVPAPAAYKYTFRRRPPALRYMGFEATCQKPDTMLPGVVVRYGSATEFPTSSFGRNPYLGEELWQVPGSARGLVGEGKVVWSDYLDVSDSMYTAVLSGAEMWLARLLGKNIEGATAVFNKDLRLAFEADTPAPVSGTRRGWSLLGAARALGYYTPSGPDTGV